MSKNKTLSAAKSAKNDEFYTQYADIQKEINAYLDYDPDTFRGKTVLLPFDDPEWSKFTRFFAENFERLGLKKLISTSYAAASKKIFVATKDTKKHKGEDGLCDLCGRKPSWYQPSLFEQQSPQFDEEKTAVRGKIFVLDHDTNKSGRIDLDDLQWNYMERHQELPDAVPHTQQGEGEPMIRIGLITFEAYCWQKQETHKGIEPVAGNLKGGWGFYWWMESNGGEEYPVCYSAATTSVMVANGSITNNPVFYYPGTQMDNRNATQDSIWFALAEYVPAVSSPVGGNSTAPAQVENHDLNGSPYRSGWGRNDGVYLENWFHSDMKDVAYFYVYKFYDKVIEKGNLK